MKALIYYEHFYDMKIFEKLWKISKMLLRYKYKGIYFELGPSGLFKNLYFVLSEVYNDDIWERWSKNLENVR